MTMKTWATIQTRTFSQNPRRTSGNDALMSSHEKNCRRTAGQYSDRLISQATTPNTTTVVAALTPSASQRGAPPERAESSRTPVARSTI